MALFKEIVICTIILCLASGAVIKDNTSNDLAKSEIEKQPEENKSILSSEEIGNDANKKKTLDNDDLYETRAHETIEGIDNNAPSAPISKDKSKNQTSIKKHGGYEQFPFFPLLTESKQDVDRMKGFGFRPKPLYYVPFYMRPGHNDKEDEAASNNKNMV